MKLKYVILALSALGLNSKEPTSPEVKSPLEYIRGQLRSEVSAAGFQLLVGIILTAVIVFSLIEVGQSIQVFLGHDVNGTTLALVGFGSLALVGSICLYLLFHSKQPPLSKKDIEAPVPLDSVFLQSLAINFVRGVIDGYESPATFTRRSLPAGVDIDKHRQSTDY